MDKNHIIDITSDMVALEADMNTWRGMTYHMRNKSDELCQKYYHMNVPGLYQFLKENHEKLPNDREAIISILDEAVISFIIDPSEREARYERSRMLQTDPNVVIIDPFHSDDQPEYNMKDLEEKYNRFLSLSDFLQDQSDAYSHDLWGYDVRNMYEIIKIKLASFANQKLEEIDPENRHLLLRINSGIEGFASDIHEEVKMTTNTMELLARKLDCVCPKETVYESVITADLADNIDKQVTNSICDYDEDIPLVTPYFTPDEMEELTNSEIDPYEYIFSKDQKELHEKLRTAAYNYTLEQSEENEKALIALGWNPSVTFNETNLRFARRRIVRWFNENKRYHIVDMSQMIVNESDIEGDIEKLEPVHIVLINHSGVNSKVIRKFTRSDYSHAGISFDNNLKNIYSFNGSNERGGNGMSVESIDFYKRAKDVGMRVVTFFVQPEVKAKLAKNINYFLQNRDKTSYAFKNLLNYVTRKAVDSSKSLSMVCSQFVDFILKSSNIDLTGKPSNLVFPGDFEIPKNESRLYITFSDKIERFKPQIVANKVRFLLRKDHSNIVTMPALEAVDLFFETKEIRYLMVATNHEAVDACLRQMRDYMVAEAIITEAKPLPLRFGKKGDLYVDLPRNLEREYQDAHMLLTSYNEDNTSGIKHQLARLFYLNTILEKRIRKSKVDDKQYKQYVDLRARVLNDFKRYIKVVMIREKNFDFEEYYKNSEFYTKTVKVDRNTMKYTGKLIKDFMMSQGI